MKSAGLRGALYALVTELTCWAALYLLSFFGDGGLLAGWILLAVLYLFSWAVFLRMTEKLDCSIGFDLSAAGTHALFLGTLGWIFANAPDGLWDLLHDGGWFAGLFYTLTWIGLAAAFGLQHLVFLLVRAAFFFRARAKGPKK